VIKLRWIVRCGSVLTALLACALANAIGQTVQKPPKTANPAEQHFHAAQTFQLTGDLEKAAAEYRAAISKGLQQLGNLRVALREGPEGVALLTRALQIDPSNGGAKLDLAGAHLLSGDLDAAKIEIEAALHQNAGDARALIFAGKIYFAQGDFDKAAEQLEAALRLQPSFEIAYTLALADLAQKKPVPAGVLFDEMLASSKPDASIRVLIGIAYRETGYFDQAANHFAKAIEIDPKKHNVHSALGLTRYLQGAEKDEEARKLFLAELSQSPGDYASCYYLGMIAARRNETNGAIEWFEKAVAAQPGSAEANVALGKLRYERSQYEDAVGALRRATASESSNEIGAATVEAHQWLGKSLEKLGQVEEAKAEFAKLRDLQSKLQSGNTESARLAGSRDIQQVLRGDARTAEPLAEKQTEYFREVGSLLAEAYHNLGVIDARAARYAEAADEFEQAAQWNPTIEKLDRNWGLAAFRATHYAKAVGPLARELEKHPQDASLRQMLGLSYFMTDQFVKSAETFRPIVDDLPENPGLLYAAGVALVRSGDASAGQNLLSRVLQRGDASPEVHVMIAQAYSDQSRFQEALDELNRALAINPRLSDAHAGIGMIYFKQGRLDEAIEEYNKELAVNANSTLAKYQIAYIMLQQNRPTDALPLLTDVLRRNPEYADAHYQTGKALLETGDATGAVEHLETAVRLQPSQAYEYYQLSLAYRRLGRTADADRALQKFQMLKDVGQKAKATTGPAN
jgi:tetratricopeptide (TPR) repeat protein